MSTAIAPSLVKIGLIKIFFTMQNFSRIPFLKNGDSSNQSEEIMKLKVLHSLQVMHYAVRDNRKLV